MSNNKMSNFENVLKELHSLRHDRIMAAVKIAEYLDLPIFIERFKALKVLEDLDREDAISKESFYEPLVYFKGLMYRLWTNQAKNWQIGILLEAANLK